MFRGSVIWFILISVLCPGLYNLSRLLIYQLYSTTSSHFPLARTYRTNHQRAYISWKTNNKEVLTWCTNTHITVGFTLEAVRRWVRVIWEYGLSTVGVWHATGMRFHSPTISYRAKQSPVRSRSFLLPLWQRWPSSIKCSLEHSGFLSYYLTGQVVVRLMLNIERWSLEDSTSIGRVVREVRRPYQ